MLTTKTHELSRDDFLYNRGDKADGFYFILKGKVELLVLDSSNSQ